MPLFPSVPAEAMAVYRTTAHQRLVRERSQTARRRQRAWEMAKAVSRLLKERFSASRVAVFGSLVHEDCFTPWSDLDLAVWGLRPEDTLRALGTVMDVATPIAVDLVDINTCRAGLRALIEEEGVEV